MKGFAKLAAIFGILAFAAACQAAPHAVLVAAGRMDAATVDANGDTAGGFGSGVCYDPENDLYLFVSDRGPGDGAIDYSPRIQAIKLTRDAKDRRRLTARIVSTTILRGPNGRPMTGLIPDADDPDQPRMTDGRWCLDSESIALAPDGTVYIGDEYGPFLYQFRRDGAYLRKIMPPQEYRPAIPDGRADFTDTAALSSGRRINAGFEGMCISADGKRAFLVLQSALTQDGHADFTRLLEMDLESGEAVGEFAVPLLDTAAFNRNHGRNGAEVLAVKDLHINELVFLSPGRFLLLERDNRGADGAKDHPLARFKAIWQLDLDGATNLLEISAEANVAKGIETGAIRPAAKSLLFNLCDQPTADFGIAPKDLAAKWEGIALTPADAGGQRRLLFVCDNDFVTPILKIGKKEIPFPRAEESVDTQLFLFDVRLE